jgi:hypothetical protein
MTRASAYRIGRAFVTVAAAIAASAAATSGAQAASAGSGSGCRTIHVGPEQSDAVAQSSYFGLRVDAGKTAREGMIVANPRRYPCRVKLLPAYGQTAANSGDTYPTTTRPGLHCAETSCWLSGLPVTVTVPPHSRRTVPFDVTVPRGTRAGQYLAGVVAQPAALPAPARPKQRHGVGAAVVARVAIGVAVTVPGPRKPRIDIPHVTLDAAGGTPVLRVIVRNSGNTWEHPEGGAVIRSGGTDRRFGARLSTVLAGDSATLSLPVAGVSRGDHQTVVTLWYDHRRRRAVWRGTIEYPKAAAAAGPSSAGPQIVVVPGGAPGWVRAVIAALGALVALLAGVLVLVFWRRRRDKSDDGDGRGVDDVAPAASLVAHVGGTGPD